MSKNYDMIATVDIDLETPLVDNTSFSNLLIVGPLPKVTPKKAPPKVGAYSSIDEVVEAGWETSGDGADPVGVAAQVAFGQSPTPTTIYIAPIQTVTTPATDGEGEATTAPESAVETLRRAMGTSGWYVACTAGVDKAEYEDIAAYIETQRKMFVYTELDCFPKAGEERGEDEDLVKPSVGTVYFRTVGVYGRVSTEQADEEIPEANKYLNVAFTAKWLNYASGSETSAFKTLASVYPSELSTTEMKALEAKNLCFFITVGNKNITMKGITVGGEWADIIRFRDWLQNDMQLRVVNLFITNPKIPYTDNGIALVQNQMIASLKAGQDAGGVAESEFDEDGNEIPGFQTSVPLASSLSASEKASRKLTKCKFKARLAGAIHFAEIKGSLTYTL